MTASRPLRVLITGATSGIGEAVAERFRASGDRLLLTGRRPQLGRPLALEESYVAGDLDDEGFVECLAGIARDEFGGLDAVVLCHGVQHEAPITGVALDDVRRVLDGNLTSVISVVKHTVPLLDPEYGSIVSVSSRLGLVGMSGQAVYSAAKGGLAMFAKAAAVELAPRGIRVNVAAPGLTMTPKIAADFSKHDDPVAHASRRAETIPLRRLAEPSEIAEPIYFLATPASSYITGAVLPIDGGYTAA